MDLVMPDETSPTGSGSALPPTLTTRLPPQTTMDTPLPTIEDPASASSATPAPEPKKPEIILITGIGGCGKSRLLADLQAQLGQEEFTYFDISEYETALWQHGNTIHDPSSDERIERLGHQYTGEPGRGGVPAFYTAELVRIRDCALVLYVNEDLQLVAQYRGQDARPRLPIPVQDLWAWWKNDDLVAKTLAHENGVPIKELKVAGMPDYAHRVGLVAANICRFFSTTEETNLADVLSLADQIGASQRSNGRIVVMDADHILTDLNTWQALSDEMALLRGEPRQPLVNRDHAHPVIFDPAKRGDFEVLRQLCYLVSNNTGDVYAMACYNIARRIAARLPPEFERLLWQIKLQESFLAVFLTSGSQLVWDMVLELVLSKKSYLMNPMVVHGVVSAEEKKPLFTPAAKAAFVKKLQEDYQLRVHTFGKEPHDVPMVNAAGENGFIVRKDWEKRAIDTDVSTTPERPLAKVLMLRTKERGLINGWRLPRTIDDDVGDIYEAIGLLEDQG
ncbi:hypothetical protein M406DRAFT_328260 [Cryphonectria parasitica EP155]|uniref:Uncharacterized protein n=1 Tax=Cryphonectria parasitica (strain ATCC 38755 / EP155) TaxID=660469 RepID=A0A9P5CRJ4_CRYP1|nr:uncharacterized protein M406DRAFT_328260 [Cryphonectria parasitica EP155]KAF3767165.1 hypothetical protein M406DRAFT_328260 [Cryphonectria parasitica EP155]